MDLYIGNLSNDITESELSKKFAKYGEVESALIMYDKVSGNCLGYAIVNMPNEADATQAVEALDRSMLKGRRVIVATTPRSEDRRAVSVASGVPDSAVN